MSQRGRRNKHPRRKQKGGGGGGKGKGKGGGKPQQSKPGEGTTVDEETARLIREAERRAIEEALKKIAGQERHDKEPPPEHDNPTHVPTLAEMLANRRRQS